MIVATEHGLQGASRVVIISNQSGIQRGKMTVEDWRTKATRIREKLGIPLQIFCSTRDGGYFRKPKPGIWEWLEKHGNMGVEAQQYISRADRPHPCKKQGAVVQPIQVEICGAQLGRRLRWYLQSELCSQVRLNYI